MTEKKYRVHEALKYNYSDIGEYVDENHTDRPLRNDEIIDKLNKQNEWIKELERHIERNTISRITVEDVLSYARDMRFCNNEEIVKAIDYIAEDLGVNLY